MRWFMRPKMPWRGVFKLKQKDLGRHLGNKVFKKSNSSISRAGSHEERRYRYQRKRLSGKRSKRGKTAALVAEEGFEPPTQGL